MPGLIFFSSLTLHIRSFKVSDCLHFRCPSAPHSACLSTCVFTTTVATDFPRPTHQGMHAFFSATFSRRPTSSLNRNGLSGD